MMSSKQRLLCALALYWENQPEQAKEIYEKVARKQDKYLLQGEVNSDLDIMETMLRGSTSTGLSEATIIFFCIITL